MSVIFHPQNFSILAPDAVFYIVQVVLAVCDLFPDASFYRCKIVGMNKTLKRISSHLSEFFQCIALADTQQRFVGVDDLFFLIGMVD